MGSNPIGRAHPLSCYADQIPQKGLFMRVATPQGWPARALFGACHRDRVPQQQFTPVSYTINDFREWDTDHKLVLSPHFQRRSVWRPIAKSYLMDTVIRGKPMPIIFLRQNIDPTTKLTVREVVDGQQRLRTILDFLNDGFKVSRVHHRELGGKKYSELPTEIRDAILQYHLSVNILNDPSSEGVLDIFKRINSYSVPLNDQELLNAKYVGHFKTNVYNLSEQYKAFLLDNGIISEKQQLRMNDAELVSDLFIQTLAGIQSKKQIETFYKKYEDEFPKAEDYVKQFHNVMDVIGKTAGARLKDSNFSRVHMFYTLFSLVLHSQHGLEGFKGLRIKNIEKHAVEVGNLFDAMDILWDKDESEWTPAEAKFMTDARRATTDAVVRENRLKYVTEKLAQLIAE